MTINPYVTAPKGELAFYAGDHYPDVVCADGKKQRLEQSLNRLMEWLVNHAWVQPKTTTAAGS